MSTVPESTLRWITERQSESLKLERLGPRILRYVTLWDAIADGEWRTTDEVARTVEDYGAPINLRQVRRIAHALALTGAVQVKTETGRNGLRAFRLMKIRRVF